MKEYKFNMQSSVRVRITDNGFNLMMEKCGKTYHSNIKHTVDKSKCHLLSFHNFIYALSSSDMHQFKFPMPFDEYVFLYVDDLEGVSTERLKTIKDAWAIMFRFNLNSPVGIDLTKAGCEIMDVPYSDSDKKFVRRNVKLFTLLEKFSTYDFLEYDSYFGAHIFISPSTLEVASGDYKVLTYDKFNNKYLTSDQVREEEINESKESNTMETIKTAKERQEEIYNCTHPKLQGQIKKIEAKFDEAGEDSICFKITLHKAVVEYYRRSGYTLDDDREHWTITNGMKG